MPAIQRCSDCGCTEAEPCAGGCAWIGPGLCSRCVSLGTDPEQAVVLTVPLLTLLAVHGTLCLGLRHPGHRGPSRALVEDFVSGLECCFLESGLLTEEQLALAHRIEAAEAPRIIVPE